MCRSRRNRISEGWYSYIGNGRLRVRRVGRVRLFLDNGRYHHSHLGSGVLHSRQPPFASSAASTAHPSFVSRSRIALNETSRDHGRHRCARDAGVLQIRGPR